MTEPTPQKSPTRTLGGYLEWIEETILAYLLAAMVILSFANVVDRRFLAGGIFWAQEATLFSFLVLIMLGMTYALRKTLHIGVDALVVLLSARWQRLITLLACAFTILYAVFMIYGTTVAFNKFFFNKFLAKAGLEDIPVTKWMIYGTIVVSFSYFLLTAVYMTYEIYTGKRRTITAAHEAAEEEEAAVREAQELREKD
jgi:C4-dicarboxylate transporter, DctQ subunit